MVRIQGIGLNYVSRIFELQGGDVWVGLEYEKKKLGIELILVIWVNGNMKGGNIM